MNLLNEQLALARCAQMAAAAEQERLARRALRQRRAERLARRAERLARRSERLASRAAARSEVAPVAGARVLAR